MSKMVILTVFTVFIFPQTGSPAAVGHIWALNRQKSMLCQVSSLCASGCKGLSGFLSCSGLHVAVDLRGPSLGPHPARCTFWYTIFKHSALFLLVLSPRRRSHSAALVSLHCAWSTEHFSPIVSGTIILIFSPLAVSLLSHSETLTLKRSFLACVGRIKACVGRTVIAVTLDCKFLAICQCGLRLSHKTLHHYSWIWIYSLSAYLSYSVSIGRRFRRFWLSVFFDLHRNTFQWASKNLLKVEVHFKNALWISAHLATTFANLLPTKQISTCVSHICLHFSSIFTFRLLWFTHQNGDPTILRVFPFPHFEAAFIRWSWLRTKTRPLHINIWACQNLSEVQCVFSVIWVWRIPPSMTVVYPSVLDQHRWPGTRLCINKYVYVFTSSRNARVRKPAYLWPRPRLLERSRLQLLWRLQANTVWPWPGFINPGSAVI